MQALGEGVFSPFASLPTWLLHQRPVMKSQCGNLDLPSHTPWKTGQGIASELVTYLHHHLASRIWRRESVLHISYCPIILWFPKQGFPWFLQYFYSQEELTCFKITRVWKKVIWIFSSVSFSGQSTDFRRLELWKADTHCITVTEVIYLSHTVLCNSISHLAWAEGDTQKSIPIAAPPKCTSKSRALQFNLNGLHQSQSWDKSILNWPKSQLSFRGHCVVYTWWLSAPDSAKWIWLNDITLEHITTADASSPCLHFFRELFYATGLQPKGKQRKVQSAGG